MILVNKLPAALLSTVLALVFSAALCALAASDMENGMNAYKTRNYALAAQYFKKAMGEDSYTSQGLFYLGHSYMGAGDRHRATETYRLLADKFPGTEEGKMAIKLLQTLSPSTAAKYRSAAGGPAVAAASATPPVSVLQQPFNRRIVVVPPLAGHPAVSEGMQRTVRSLVQGLPRNVYDYLDKGGATVNLAPNVSDKWPNSGDDTKPNVAGMTMGEEPGRTYNHDVYVYERAKERGSTRLKEARDTGEVARVCYHELGHAMDEISGMSSNGPAFKAALDADLLAMPADIRTENMYYCNPCEACAEIIGRILAGSDNSFTSNTPKLKAFLKDKFKI